MPDAIMAANQRAGEVGEILRQARRQRRKVQLQRLVDRVVLMMLVLLVWEGVVRLGLVREFFISRPTRLAADLYGLFSSGDIWPHLLITCYETLGGLVIGTVFGVLTGFAAGLSPRFGDAIEPIIVAFNSMPRIAIAPLFVIWLGFGPESKIALAALVVYFVVFFNTVGGIRAIPPALSHSIRTMGGTKYNVLRFVTFPFCLSWVFAATKVSISMALLGAVVGEFVGSQAGLGWLMLQASGTLDTTRLFSCMVILAAFGSLLFLLVKLVEDRMLRWRPH